MRHLPIKLIVLVAAIHSGLVACKPKASSGLKEYGDAEQRQLCRDQARLNYDTNLAGAKQILNHTDSNVKLIPSIFGGMAPIPILSTHTHPLVTKEPKHTMTASTVPMKFCVTL